MRLNSAARTICVLTMLICSGALWNCGGGSSAQDAGGGVKLAQIIIAPANPTISKGTSVQLSATGAYSNGTQQPLTASVVWQTSQAAIATVNKQGDVTGVSEGLAQVSASYEGVTGSTSVTVGTAALVGITISPNPSSLPVGESEQLTVTGSFSDGSVQNLTQSATWSSSASGVASVNAGGSVLANAAGTATISATVGSVTGSASVTVGTAVLVGITVSPNPSSLPVGESEQLTATGSFSDGSVQNLTQSVTWSSSASGVASVSAGGSVLANAVGTATINATAGSVTGSASLTVTPAAVVAVNIVPATLSVVLGSSSQLQAIATWSDGTTQNVTTVVAWSSTPAGIATVSSGGLATAQQVGSATVLATDGSVSGSASLTVVPLLFTNYFDRASAVKSGIDGTVRLINPGLTSGSLCAMVYVFDQNQELNECCGCSVSDSALLNMSLLQDLTANPLTGIKSQGGIIMVIPSDIGQNPQCDPGSLSPTGVILGWETNVQALPDGTYQVTETSFQSSPLNNGNTTTLAAECGFIEQSGGGQGVCSCGTGH